MADRSIVDTYPRPAGIKIANYTFDIALNDANDKFVVRDTVDVRFVASGVAIIRSRSVQVPPRCALR